MNIVIQSFLNSAMTVTVTVEPSTAIEAVKTLIQSAEGVDVAIMDLYYNGVQLVNGTTLSDYNVQANSYINSSNTISSLTTKSDRQVAKLNLAALKRAADGKDRPYYDITQLPTQYDANNIIDNPNADGLVLGRPWISSPPGVLTTNLTLYLDPNNATSYPGTGNTYTDLSGNGRDFTRSAGTFVSSPVKSWDGGVFNRTNYLGTDTTIQAWINTSAIGNTGSSSHRFQMQIMSAESLGNPANPTDFGFGIQGATPYGGKLGFGTGPSDSTVISNSIVSTGAWVNVAVTRVESTGIVKLYINGVLDAAGFVDSGTGALTSQTNLLIGTGGDGGKTWVGLMGSILTYSSVLSDASILQNYNIQKATYGL